MEKIASEVYSIAKPLGIAILTIWMAFKGLDEKLIRFEQKFETMTISVTELNRSVKELTYLVDDSSRKVKIMEIDIKELKSHVGMK